MHDDLLRTLDVGARLAQEAAKESMGVVGDDGEDDDDLWRRRVAFALRERGAQRMSIIARLCRSGPETPLYTVGRSEDPWTGRTAGFSRSS